LLDHRIGRVQRHPSATGVRLGLAQLRPQDSCIHSGNDLPALNEIAFLQQYCLYTTGQLCRDVNFRRLESPVRGNDSSW